MAKKDTRKKILLLLFVIALSSKAYTQTSYAGVGVGAAIPIGAFAATNGGYEKAGYAKTGVSYNLNYTHLYNNNFGLAFTSFYTQSAVNNAAALRGNGSYAAPSSSSATGFSGGIIYQFKKIPVYIKAQAGLCFVTTANIIVYDNGGNYTQYTSDAAPGVMVIGGIGTLLPLSRHFAFCLSVEAVDCAAKPSVDAEGAHPLDYFTTINYPQAFINVQGGIEYVFQRGARGRK